MDEIQALSSHQLYYLKTLSKSEDVDIIKSQSGTSHYSTISNTMIWRTKEIITTAKEAVKLEISLNFKIYSRDLELIDRSKLSQLITTSLNSESVEENLDNHLISTYLIKVNGKYEFRDIILRKYIALQLVSRNDSNDSLDSYRFDYLIMMPFVRLGKRLKTHRLDGFLSTLLENFDFSTKTSLISKLNHYAQKYGYKVLGENKQLVVHLEELFILIKNLLSHQHQLATTIKEIVLSTYLKQDAKLLISLGNEVDDHLDFL